MCLEEMYSTEIKTGAIFYISSHRRKEIVFSEKQREAVSATAKLLNEMLESKQVPIAESSSKCLRCSLRDICMPDISGNVSSYMKRIINEARRDTE